MAEYFRLKELGVGDAELLRKLEEAYHTLVSRTDPLSQHRNLEPTKTWKCPKVRTVSFSDVEQELPPPSTVIHLHLPIQPQTASVCVRQWLSLSSFPVHDPLPHV